MHRIELHFGSGALLHSRVLPTGAQINLGTKFPGIYIDVDGHSVTYQVMSDDVLLFGSKDNRRRVQKVQLLETKTMDSRWVANGLLEELFSTEKRSGSGQQTIVGRIIKVAFQQLEKVKSSAEAYKAIADNYHQEAD